MASGSKASVRSVHVSKANPRNVFFMGTGKSNWVTSDMGKTYEQVQDLDLHEVRLHSRQSNWMLGASMSAGCQDEEKGGCFKVLYVTKDFGRNWEVATNYVVQFDWAPPAANSTAANKRGKTPKHKDIVATEYKDPAVTPEDNLVFATIQSKKRGNQVFGKWDKNIHFYLSYDFFKTEVLSVKHGNRFLFGEYDYLFVAAVNPADETEVSLQVSRDLGAKKRFQTALLPVELTEHSYTILDTSEGTVFLHVNHQPFDQNAPTGHVYISDWSGVSYSLSLPYNHRSADGKCDFEKVEGIEGIYLANFIDDDEPDVDEGIDSQDGNHQGGAGGNRPKHLKAKTVITFDKGGIWSYLEAPDRDSMGNKIKCGAGCHLHLHGITDLYGPFYSSATATGLIMGTGMVGSYLHASMSEINTYLSRDAGLSWYEVNKGSHIYEFGDHGGLIVMAYDEGETDTVLYSWDEGITWTPLKISDAPMQVENIIIEPEATSQQFVVYGWQNDNGVLVYLDFAELHMKECRGHDAPNSDSSDYETWTPSDGRLGGKCLLGHKVSYTRRKRASKCFNPEEHERKQLLDHCACTEEDFECDYGYYRKIDGGACVEDPSVTKPEQTECRDFHYVTKGYRRVSGDTCVGGSQWERVRVPCPAWSHGVIGKVIFVILLVVVLALAFVTGFVRVEMVEDCAKSIKARFSSGGYQLVGKQGNMPASMVDDDQFGLDGQEFTDSAQLLNHAAGDDDDDDVESQFTSLPERQTKSSAVPRLSGPAGDNDQDDLLGFN
eukprot:TRINITY_DN65833_c8_g1_i1.p1 TRINITY_DN65833_c8_g1~~TRINITY_DN65833_c8_g1_i1.p1  ORF type:complete len:891 (+),score=515.98 TRINITY_DN65833_c8_g1_i1:350-2674(+)